MALGSASGNTLKSCVMEVIEILIAQPPTDRALGDAVQAINAVFGWSEPATLLFIEELSRRKLVALRTEAVDRATAPERRAQSWWEKSERFR